MRLALFFAVPLSMLITQVIIVYSIQCPDKWIQFTSSSSSSTSTSCYYATGYDESMSQSKCQNLCDRDFSASLVSLQSVEENEFVFDILNIYASFNVNKIDRDAFSEHYYWTGLYNTNAVFQGQRKSHLEDISEWHWITDRNISSKKSIDYFNWNDGQPDNYCGMEHCAGVSLDNGMWEDIDCRVHLRCICELNLRDSNDDDDNASMQSLELYNATLAIREPKGEPYASGGPYRSCPRDSEDLSYVIILNCSIILAFILLLGAIIAISSPSFLPNSQLRSCFSISFQGSVNGRQKLPTDNRDDDMSIATKSATDNHHSDENEDHDNEDDDECSDVMIVQVPSAATSGSLLEVIDPRSDKCRMVIVPDGVVPGEYFEVHRDTWKVSSAINDSVNVSRLTQHTEFTGCFCMYGDPISALALMSTKTRIHTEAFDCIRGMGSLQVSLGHFFTFYANFENAATPEFGGGNAVLMFFVMSGFLMTIGYAGMFLCVLSSINF